MAASTRAFGALTLPSLLAAALAVAGPTTAAGQPYAEASLGGSLQSLSSATISSGRQDTLSGGARIGVDFDDDRARAFYDLEGGTYPSAGDWSYFLHEGAAHYRVDLGGRGHHLHFGGGATLRRNGDAWSFANYGGVGGWVNLELRPASGWTLRTGYRLDRRWFPDLSALDQTEQQVFASLLVNLPSRTTLITEAYAGFKSYAGEPMPTEPAAAATLPAGEAEGSPTASDQEQAAGEGEPAGPGDPGGPAGAPNGAGGDPAGGPGSGSNSGHGSGAGGRGPGGMGPPLRPVPPGPPPAEGDRARQVTLLARVAQSLGERTGISLQGTWRTTSGRVPPAVVTTPAGFFDDGVYDDPFASNLVGLHLRLKHVFASGAVLEGWGRRQHQDFVATVALDPEGYPLSGEPLREDRVWRAGASLSLPLFPSSSGPLAVELDVGYAYTRSTSNDAFYAYANHAGGLGLSIRY